MTPHDRSSSKWMIEVRAPKPRWRLPATLRYWKLSSRRIGCPDGTTLMEITAASTVHQNKGARIANARRFDSGLRNSLKSVQHNLRASRVAGLCKAMFSCEHIIRLRAVRFTQQARCDSVASIAHDSLIIPMRDIKQKWQSCHEHVMRA